MKHNPKDYHQKERILWQKVDDGHDPKVDAIIRPESASTRGAWKGCFVKSRPSCLCWGLIYGLWLSIVALKQGSIDLIVLFC